MDPKNYNFREPAQPSQTHTAKRVERTQSPLTTVCAHLLLPGVLVALLVRHRRQEVRRHIPLVVLQMPVLLLLHWVVQPQRLAQRFGDGADPGPLQSGLEPLRPAPRWWSAAFTWNMSVLWVKVGQEPVRTCSVGFDFDSMRFRWSGLAKDRRE